MEGEQSRYENREGDGRVTEVANFDFRYFKKEEDGIGTSGDYKMGIEKEDKFCASSLQRERNVSWCEKGGVRGVGFGRNVGRMEYLARFHNRAELMNMRS